jgi:centriolar protein POC1
MRPYKFIGHKGAVHDVAISPNGNLIASASADETVRLWANSVNGASQTVKAHTAPVKSVDFNNDGRLLLTASDDKIIKVINVADRKFQASLVGHTNWVRSARFSPDSRLVGSASDDHTVKLWDVGQKSTIHTFIDHLEDVNVVRFHPDGTCIASGSVDKKIKIWDIRSKRLIQHYDAHTASVTSISFHPSGNYLLSSSMDATLKVWDLKMGQILYTLYGHEGPATNVSFSNCGDFFCSGGTDAILMVWKSNVRNMDEELEVLSKTDMSKMKSNRKKIEDDILSGGDVNMNIPYNPLGKKLSSQSTSTIKFKVTQEKNIKKVEVKNEPVKNLNSSTTSNMFNKLPEELSSTFEKMISQLDIIAKTMKIMDQRIATVENQVSDLFITKRKQNENKYEDDFQNTYKSAQGVTTNYENNNGNNYENYSNSKKLEYTNKNYNDNYNQVK